MNKSQFLSNFLKVPSKRKTTLKRVRLPLRRGVDIIHTCGGLFVVDGFVYRANGDEVNITMKEAIRLSKIRGII
jgi:hypothetical protein